MDRKENKIKHEWGILEADAQEEIGMARRSRTNEERDEHYINAMIAEDAASYLVNNYRGI